MGMREQEKTIFDLKMYKFMANERKQTWRMKKKNIYRQSKTTKINAQKHARSEGTAKSKFIFEYKKHLFGAQANMKEIVLYFVHRLPMVNKYKMRADWWSVECGVAQRVLSDNIVQQKHQK